jgi:large subunit ribosomal protein L3
VPGHKGNFVYIKDAFYKKPDLSVLPFPTYFASVDDDTSPLIAELGETDPYLQE